MHRSFLILFIILVCAGSSAAAADIRFQTVTTKVPLVIVTTATPTPAPTTAAYGALAVQSTPSGASVIIDGSPAGTTPYTIRTLSAGTHTLVLSLGGYEDISDSIAIESGGLVTKTYTLQPLTAATTVTATDTTASAAAAPVVPAARVITPEAATSTATVTATVTATRVTRQTTTPVQEQAAAVSVADTSGTPGRTVQVPGLFTRMNITRPVPVRPLIIAVAGRQKMPVITSDSPYFTALINSSRLPMIPPSIILEVDNNTVRVQNNVIHPGGGETCTLAAHMCPDWEDNALYFIKPSVTNYTFSHFRWVSDEKNVTAFVQVSRHPFLANSTAWQNQYVPGLVGSGPAGEYYADSYGNHYFDLNFALYANHNPSDPPVYTGFTVLDNGNNGRGMSLPVVKIPGTGAGFPIKKLSIGPVSFGVPVGIVSVPAGALTESDLGNPNENLPAVCYSCTPAHTATAAETIIGNMDQVFYVRVVPIHSDGTAGIPSYPVEVRVVRPQPCPADTPSDTETDVIARPPSAKVASFYLQAFLPNDWIHTDQNGKLVAPARYLTVTAPPGCDPSQKQNAMTAEGMACSAYISLTNGGNANYHYIVNPPDSSWYDTFFDVLEGLFEAFETVVNAVSAAWANIQALAVQVVAYAVQALTFNTIKCGDSDTCKGVLQTGLSVAMTYCGIPPTVPNFAELEHMGTGYIAAVAAEELGAGDIYNNLPDNVKDEISGNAAGVAGDLAGSLDSQTSSITATAAGSWYIPDPMYYQSHPAFVIVKVSNPNNQPSDAATLTVVDSQSLYRQSEEVHIPPLSPGQSVSVPVVLRENFQEVYQDDCQQNAYYSMCDGSTCIPCYWNLWYYHALQQGGNDVFWPVITERVGGHTLTLKPDSSGKLINTATVQTYDDLGVACKPTHTNTYLKYPQGWVMERLPISEHMPDLFWGHYTFTNGETGMLVGS